MSEFDPNPEDTYAVIVGIEKYEPPEEPLKGAASNALEFAKWLSECKVPSGNIFLFISELDENKGLVDADKFSTQIATRQNIIQSIFTKIKEKIKEKPDCILYFFWAGHGYIINHNGYDEERLSYSIDNPRETFNLTSLLNSLKSNTFINFRKQMLFIDACRIYWQNNKQQFRETYEHEPPNNNCEQFVLKATQKGEPAHYDGNKGGFFSEVLLEELRKNKKLLLPKEMREIIAENIRKVFDEGKYKDKQLPIFLYHKHEDEREESLGLTKPGKTSKWLEQRWDELSPILSEISERYILYISCYLVLLKFTQDVNGQYPEINNFLKPEDNAQKDILNTILKNILFKVIDGKELQEEIFIVIKFVNWLLIILKQSEEIQKKLRTWNTETTNQLQERGINVQIIKEEIKQEINGYQKKYEKYHPYLIIVSKPKSSKKMYLSADLLFQKDNDEAELKFPIADEIEVALTNIHDKFDDFLIFSYNIIQLYGFTKEKLIVEMFLPNLQLVEASEKCYENIKIKTDIYNNRNCIGCKHKFVVRSLERLLNLVYTELLPIKHKWDQLNNFKLTEKKTYKKIKWIDCIEKDNFTDSDILGIILLSSSGRDKMVMKLLQNQIISKGLPLFVWIRSTDFEQELRQEIEEILNVKNLNDLLENIRNKRSDACRENEEQKQNSLGYHLGFLCDNPYRLPLKYTIISDIVVDLGF